MKHSLVTITASSIAALMAVAGTRLVEKYETPESTADMVERVQPGVVLVMGVSPINLYGVFPPGRGPDPASLATVPPKAFGAGFVVDSTGYIVTAAHVASVENSQLVVTLSDGRSLPAELIGGNKTLDVSVLKISVEKPIPQLSWGNSDALRPGDKVVTIGQPFRLTYSASEGIVSGLHRATPKDAKSPLEPRPDDAPTEDYIQYDASTNPGNSGGPLFDEHGQVIGIVDQIYSRSGASAGVAFAIPSMLVKKVAEDIIAYGEVKPGRIGIDVKPVNEAREIEIGSPAVEVTAVDPAQEKSGIMVGDIIIAFDGKRLMGVRSLAVNEVLSHPGESHKLTVLKKDSKQIDLDIVMEGKPLPPARRAGAQKLSAEIRL